MPLKRPEAVLLLQDWSTAIIQRRTAGPHLPQELSSTWCNSNASDGSQHEPFGRPFAVTRITSPCARYAGGTRRSVAILFPAAPRDNALTAPGERSMAMSISTRLKDFLEQNHTSYSVMSH